MKNNIWSKSIFLSVLFLWCKNSFIKELGLLSRVKSVARYLITRRHSTSTIIWVLLLNRFKLIHFIDRVVFIINRVTNVYILIWVTFLDICGSLTKSSECTTHYSILEILWVIDELLIINKFALFNRFLLYNVDSWWRLVLNLVLFYICMALCLLGVLIWWSSSIVWLRITVQFTFFI